MTSAKLIPDGHEDKALNFRKINYLLSRYFIGLLLQLFIVFVLYFTVLLLFGVPNAFIIGFLCCFKYHTVYRSIDCLCFSSSFNNAQ
jgi:predicted PurR-regulated permease PerM